MPYNKTPSPLELNFAAKFQICKVMFKSSLTTSLIAGILSSPNFGNVLQATASTREIEKTANDRKPKAIYKNNLDAKNKSNTAASIPKISHSVGSIRTLIANLTSLSSAKEHSANDSILNPTEGEHGSTSSDYKIANIDRANFTSANQNLVISSESTTSLAAKPKAGVHIVSRGDTISKIARRYGVSKDDLVRLNQLNNSNVIFISQRLKIPATNILTSVEPLPNTPQQSTRATSTPVKVTDKESYKPISSLNPKSDRQIAEEDPYITKLKAEIEQLRNQKQQSPQGNRNASASSNSSLSGDRVSPTTQEKLPNIETVSVVTSVPASNSPAGLLPQDSIALQLPPLPPADEYLPSAFDGYIWPAQGILTSGYGWRWGRMHRGIDIAAPVGTPIVAAAAGEVINAGWHSGYGNLVKIEHLDGSVTVYAHNYKILVTHGQKVERGEQIAEMGNTGRSTGPHLHFEIRLADETAVDPLAFLDNQSIANND